MKVVEAVSGTIYCFQIKREAADCVYSIQYISPEEIWKQTAYSEQNEHSCITCCEYEEDTAEICDRPAQNS